MNEMTNTSWQAVALGNAIRLRLIPQAVPPLLLYIPMSCPSWEASPLENYINCFISLDTTASFASLCYFKEWSLKPWVCPDLRVLALYMSWPWSAQTSLIINSLWADRLKKKQQKKTNNLGTKAISSLLYLVYTWRKKKKKKPNLCLIFWFNN